MAKTTSEIRADWEAAMSDPSGPRRYILGPFHRVESYFYNESNLTMGEIEVLRRDGRRETWGARLWRKLKADDNEDDICNTARVLGVGQDMGWITHNHDTEEFTMSPDFNDVEGLMWQVAISNWETTKKDLTLLHLNTMVRIGLHNLTQSVVPHPTARYSPDEAQKALEKLTLLVGELNERMRQTQRGALPEAKKS